MKSSALFTGNAQTLCTVMEVIRQDGQTFYYTDHDGPVGAGGNTFTPAPGVAGIKTTLTNNASVSTVQTRSAWVPVIQEADVVAGIYDNALVSIGFADWSTSGNVLWMFSGSLGVIKATPDGFQAEAQSALWVLQRPLGIFMTPGCRHTLGAKLDPQGVWGCQLDLTPWTKPGTITHLDNSMVWEISGISGQTGISTVPTPPTLSVTQNVAGQYLPPGIYNYSISAVAGGEESPTSPVVSATVLPNSNGVGGGTITLTWQPVTGATSYNVYGNTTQQLLMNVSGTTWTDNGSAGAGGSPPLFGDWYAQGILTMTSGAAKGMQTTVKTLQGSKLYLLLPLGRTPAAGDGFTLSAGCDKSISTCQYKFNNVVNFGGFPDLTPQREWM